MIKVEVGNIQELTGIEVIVNAANYELRRGAGVCGAIFKAAGPLLEDACREIAAANPAFPGSVRVSPSFDLAAQGYKDIFHAVGPDFRLSDQKRAGSHLLGAMYFEIFYLTRKLGISSIAIPAISTGIYGCPVEVSAHFAIIEAMRDESLRKKGNLPELTTIFSVWPENKAIYEKAQLRATLVIPT